MSELWAKWEGEVINGGLPLRRLVGVSDHSGVFLTEAPAYGLPNAAIKLVPAIPTLAESQLAHWNAAAGLTHPRLLRLFAMGRCQLGSLHFLYVLMEYADQNLAQLLENRALTDVEARETLPPTLDALAFLHSRNMVQGQLKPSNILVVGDQLKLASDTIRPAGELATSISMSSAYDPPEGWDGSFSTAGDIWALGVTLFEALTRTTPEKPDERSHGVVLPPDFPPTLADVIRECLSRRPADRPSVIALQDWVSGKVKYRGAPAAAPESAVTAADRAALAGAGVASADSGAPGVADAPAVAGDSHRIGAGAGAAAAGGTRDRQYAGDLAGSGPSGASPGRGDATIGASSESQRIVSGAGVAAASDIRDRQRASADTATAGIARTGARPSGPAGGSPASANYGAPTGGDHSPTDRGASQAAAFSPAISAQAGAAGSTAGNIPGRLTIRAVVERAPLEDETPRQRSYTPWVVVGIAIVAIGWGAVRLLGGHSSSTPSSTTSSEPPSTNSQPAPESGASPTQAAPSSQASRSARSQDSGESPPSAASGVHPRSPRATDPTPGGGPTSRGGPASRAGAASDAGPGAVAHEEIPTVPRSALATIHGRIKVVVRVTADESGNVISDNLDRPGPSKYFARLATQAARKWKFVPDGHKSGGVWLIHFEFARTGATAHATGAKT